MNDLSRIVNKKHIIYDFDGTIAKVVMDWSGWHVGVEKIFQKYDPTFVRNGLVNPFVNDMIARFGQPLRDEVCKFNEQYELQNRTGMVVNKKLVEFIQKNSSKNQYILTLQNRLLLNKLLAELKIDNCFIKTITRDDVLFVKPNPEGLNKIVEGQNVADFIYLGDTTSDEQSALSVGMDFEWIKIEN